MNRAAQRVDRLTRAGEEALSEAVRVRAETPPFWRPRARREAKRRYGSLIAQAQDLTDRARRVK